jgi:hypothetical protein
MNWEAAIQAFNFNIIKYPHKYMGIHCVNKEANQQIYCWAKPSQLCTKSSCDKSSSDRE